MLNHMVEHRDRLSAVFAAIADPTRRALVERLARRPATITQLARPFSMSLAAVSKHVIVLERAGLLRRRARGREHVCSLRARTLRRADAWLEHYRRFWNVRLDALEAYVTVKAKERRGEAHGQLR